MTANGAWSWPRNTVFAQESEQRQQWQTEHREVVALDALEQLCAEAFKLIGADGAQNIDPLRGRDSRPETLPRTRAS